MYHRDEETTTLITKEGIYCYTRMPFELKNAKATYQRLVKRMFEGQIEKNIKVYIDDIMVKTKATKDHIQDLEEVFSIIQHYEMRFNPKNVPLGQCQENSLAI